MEFRLNAEDPERSFAPCPGSISLFIPPELEGVRTDSFVYSGYSITPHYDSMIAKLIVRSENRAETIKLAKHAFRDIILEGLPTTIPFHTKMLENGAFLKSDYDINFVDKLYS
jgi:acetyl-CoA carboxylase biotin carboxylase subunit